MGVSNLPPPWIVTLAKAAANPASNVRVPKDPQWVLDHMQAFFEPTVPNVSTRPVNRKSAGMIAAEKTGHSPRKHSAPPRHADRAFEAMDFPGGKDV